MVFRGGGGEGRRGGGAHISLDDAQCAVKRRGYACDDSVLPPIYRENSRLDTDTPATHCHAGCHCWKMRLLFGWTRQPRKSETDLLSTTLPLGYPLTNLINRDWGNFSHGSVEVRGNRSRRVRCNFKNLENLRGIRRIYQFFFWFRYDCNDRVDFQELIHLRSRNLSYYTLFVIFLVRNDPWNI